MFRIDSLVFHCVRGVVPNKKLALGKAAKNTKTRKPMALRFRTVFPLTPFLLADIAVNADEQKDIAYKFEP